MNSALVSWEAEYHDGTVVRERQGARYQDLDRDQIKAFRLVSPGEVLMELRVKGGQNGHGIGYRRRTIMENGGREVWFMLGMIPGGPVISFQPETEQVVKADSFQPGSGPLGQMVPLPFERWTNTAHSADVRTRASMVRLPSGQLLNV